MVRIQNHVSDEDIEVALKSVAHLVEKYGEKYWPIFERLEAELKSRRSRSKRLNRALKRARPIFEKLS